VRGSATGTDTDDDLEKSRNPILLLLTDCCCFGVEGKALVDTARELSTADATAGIDAPEDDDDDEKSRKTTELLLDMLCGSDEAASADVDDDDRDDDGINAADDEKSRKAIELLLLNVLCGSEDEVLTT